MSLYIAQQLKYKYLDRVDITSNDICNYITITILYTYHSYSIRVIVLVVEDVTKKDKGPGSFLR